MSTKNKNSVNLIILVLDLYNVLQYLLYIRKRCER